MPISEKTVEINVSTELLNYLYRRTGQTYVAIAPTQRAEGKLGYDVGYYGPGWACLIQYKRAYRKKAIWEWRLNRNRQKDQHQILQDLDAAGVPVYYAFPYFSEPSEVLQKRIQLLNSVFWFRPSSIRPIGGPTGHHEVRYDPRTQKWSVHSEEEGEIEGPDSLGEVMLRTTADRFDASLEGLVVTLNGILGEVSASPRLEPDPRDFPLEVAEDELYPDSLGWGQYLMLGAEHDRTNAGNPGGG